MAQTFSFEEAMQPGPAASSAAFDSALKAEKVDSRVAEIARSIYQQESGSGKNTKTSNAGAVGGMQIVPATFKSVADKDWDINDPEQNARAGIRYVKQMSDQAGGDPALTAAGYYGGPGGLEKARKGVAVKDPRNPNAPDTLQYGQQVAARVPKGAVAQVLDKVTDAVIPSAGAQELPAGKDRPVQATFSFEEALAPAPGAAPASAAPKRSMVDELGRQLGLTVRAGVSGAAAIPAMMSDAVTGPINAGLDAVAGAGKGFRFQQAGHALNNVMTAAGVPQPENATERVVQDVAGGMAGAGGFVGAGKALASTGGAVTQAVGKQLAAGPGLQVASAAAGTGAAGATREGGGGAGAQLAAGLAGGLAPGLAPLTTRAAYRGVLRGGEAGRVTAERNIAAFEAAGTTPTLGQATEGRLARATESLLAKTPGGAGVIAKRAQAQADDMAQAVQRLSDELAPGANATNAGEAISRGIRAFKDGVKVVQQRLYADLDTHLPAATPIQVTKTQDALKALNAGIEGAPSLSEFFKNAKIKGIDRALQADLEKAAAAGADDLAAQAGTLPYQAIKKLRTLVGNEISDSNLVSDVPRSKWQALYGALSDDLGVAATKAGPEAEASWKWANQYTRSQMGRLEQLSGIVSKDAPEKIFAAATAGTLEGDTVIKRVVNALPKQERREVAAAVLQRLGRATAGQQNAMGDAFSSETFLTNLSKLSPASRKTLFGRTDAKGIEEQLGQFAKVAESRRDGGRVFANPSGTAPATAQIAMSGGLAAGAATSLVTGNPVPLAAALAVPAAAYGGAKLLTGPGAARTAATKTPVIAGTQAAVVEATTRVNDVTAQPGPKTFSFEEAMSAAPVAPGQPQEADPVRIQLNGMAQPDSAQPMAQPAQEPDVQDVPIAPDAPQSAAEIDPASAFTSATRPDGSLAIKGDSQALVATLLSAGIPAHGLMRTPDGLVVRRSHAENVRAAIDRMQVPAPEVVAGAAAGPLEGQASNAFSPADNAAAVAAPGAGGSDVDPVQSNASVGIAGPPDGALSRASKAIAMAQPTPGVAGMQPARERDIFNPKGDPFATLFSARLAAQRAGDGYAPVALEDGTFLVRKNAASADGAGADALADYGDGTSGTSDQAHTGAAEPEVQMAPHMSQIAAAGPTTAQAPEIGQNLEPSQANPAKAAINNVALQPYQQVADTGIAQSQDQSEKVQNQTLQAGTEAQAAPTQVAEAGADAPGAQAAGAEPAPGAVAPTGATNNQNATVASIQRVHAAGETEVAELMQRSYDRDVRLSQAPTELDAMRSVAPDLVHTQRPEFDQTYMQLRGTGIKPAEAAARASMLATIQEQGPAVGMSAQRLSELLGNLAKLPLVDAPGFAQQYAVSLIEKGEIEPFEGADQIAQLLAGARDASMYAMAESAYGENVG